MASRVWESAIVAAPIAQVWELARQLSLDKLTPASVKAVIGDGPVAGA